MEESVSGENCLAFFLQINAEDRYSLVGSTFATSAEPVDGASSKHLSRQALFDQAAAHQTFIIPYTRVKDYNKFPNLERDCAGQSYVFQARAL